MCSRSNQANDIWACFLDSEGNDLARQESSYLIKIKVIVVSWYLKVTGNWQAGHVCESAPHGVSVTTPLIHKSTN